MSLPQIIKELIRAQNNFDSNAYANCFTENAIVQDEGKFYTGRSSIKNWIEEANWKYQVTMKPILYSENIKELEAEISGTFPGSPLVLKYQYEFENGLIQSLKIV